MSEETAENFGPIEMHREDHQVTFSVSVKEKKIKTALAIPSDLGEKERREYIDLWLSKIGPVMQACGHHANQKA